MDEKYSKGAIKYFVTFYIAPSSFPFLTCVLQQQTNSVVLANLLCSILATEKCLMLKRNEKDHSVSDMLYTPT